MSSSPHRSESYLAFVRRQPCAVCSSTEDIQAHHHGRAAGGMGLKTCDLHTVPLCPAHHHEWHATGRFKSRAQDAFQAQATLWRAVAETLRKAVLQGILQPARVDSTGGPG